MTELFRWAIFLKPDICVWNFHIWTNPCKALSTKPYLQVWVSDWEMPRSPLKRTFDHYWLCVGKCMHIWAMWAHICTHGFGWNFKTLFSVAEEESAVAGCTNRGFVWEWPWRFRSSCRKAAKVAGPGQRARPRMVIVMARWTSPSFLAKFWWFRWRHWILRVTTLWHMCT